MPVLYIFGVIMLLLFFSLIVKPILDFLTSKNSPVVNTKARLLYGDYDYYRSVSSSGDMTTVKPYLLFELDTGSTVKFRVDESVIRQRLAEGWGTLTFKGSNFIKFENEFGDIEN